MTAARTCGGAGWRRGKHGEVKEEDSGAAESRGGRQHGGITPGRWSRRGASRCGVRRAVSVAPAAPPPPSSTVRVWLARGFYAAIGSSSKRWCQVLKIGEEQQISCKN